jgi:TRAP-type mannitol/chloroaromatic compound transport system substrate-binding protein
MAGKYDAGNPAALAPACGRWRAIAAVPAAGDGSLLQGGERSLCRDLGRQSDFKKVYDSMVAFRGNQYLWWQVAEYTYDSFMIRALRS